MKIYFNHIDCSSLCLRYEWNTDTSHYPSYYEWNPYLTPHNSLLDLLLSFNTLDVYVDTIECSSLDLCKRCGNLRRIACTRCRGTGSVREGAIFAINLVEDLYDTIGSETGKKLPCTKCQAKGYFSCPGCSRPWSIKLFPLQSHVTNLLCQRKFLSSIVNIMILVICVFLVSDFLT